MEDSFYLISTTVQLNLSINQNMNNIIATVVILSVCVVYSQAQDLRCSRGINDPEMVLPNTAFEEVECSESEQNCLSLDGSIQMTFGNKIVNFTARLCVNNTICTSDCPIPIVFQAFYSDEMPLGSYETKACNRSCSLKTMETTNADITTVETTTSAEATTGGAAEILRMRKSLLAFFTILSVLFGGIV